MKRFYFFVFFLFFANLSYGQYAVKIAGASAKRLAQSGANIEKAYDDDLNTIYHSKWELNAMPDTVDFTFLNASSINKIQYTPRQTGLNGVWTALKVQYATKNDPTTFQTVGTYNWAANNSVKTIDLSAIPINQPFIVRFVITAAYGNFSSCAEMNFYSADVQTAPVINECTFNTADNFANYKDTKIAATGVTANNSNSDGPPSNAIDGNLNTLYHSRYSTNRYYVSPATPIELTFNFASSNMDYLVYYPRLTNDNGNFGRVEILYSTATSGAFTLVTSYDAGFSATPSVINFPTTLSNVRRIMVRVLTGKADFASAAEIEFYTKNGTTSFPTVFADYICSELKAGTTQADIDAITSPFFKSLAQCLFNNTYTKKFRVQNYKVYPSLQTTAAALKTGTYSPFENPTGIFFKGGTKAIIFVPNVSVLPSLRVRDFAKGEAATDNTYSLKQGLNTIDIINDGLGYISYYNDNANLPDLKINIASGEVNGYYDPTTDTDADWVKYITNGVYGSLDLKGTYIGFNTFKNLLLSYSTQSGTDLIGAWDKVVWNEFMMQGYFKYNRVPKNRMFAWISNGGGWFAGGIGAHFDYNWDPANVSSGWGLRKDPWGIAHELGHVNQTRPGLKWIGTTEVTNNIHSAYNQYVTGKAFPGATRLEAESSTYNGNEIAGGRVNNYFAILGKNTPIYDKDVMVMLMPFWQLTLYYQFAGAAKGLPTLAQRLSGTPAPTNATDVAYGYADIYEKVRQTNEAGLNNGQLLINFYKNACDAFKEDLTDFFKRSGYLVPINKLVDDYASEQLTVTQQMIDNAVAEVKAKNYPMPASPVLNYISARSVNAYKDGLLVTGSAGVGASLNATTVTIDQSLWKNVVAYEVYKNEDLQFAIVPGSDDASFATTKVPFANGATKIYAVSFDGSKKLVYPSVDPNITLGVKLIDFKANLTTDGTLLKWQTSAEENNLKFEIFKSDDGKKFVRIGERKGSGTTNNPTNYQFLDVNFKTSAYYRLQQIDNDGKITKFDDLVRYVKGLNEVATILYPNPTTTNFYIKGTTNKYLIEILDVTGKPVKKMNSENSFDTNVDVRELASGTYIVKIISATGTEIKKLVKK